MTSNADKNRRSAYSRAAVRRKLVETVGDDHITYDLNDDGEHVFEIEHPFFRSEEQRDALEPLEDSDEKGIAQVVLGDRYDEFVEAGGKPSFLSELFVAVNLDMRDSLQGRPTR
jgi:hypothetical protein